MTSFAQSLIWPVFMRPKKNPTRQKKKRLRHSNGRVVCDTRTYDHSSRFRYLNISEWHGPSTEVFCRWNLSVLWDWICLGTGRSLLPKSIFKFIMTFAHGCMSRMIIDSCLWYDLISCIPVLWDWMCLVTGMVVCGRSLLPNRIVYAGWLWLSLYWLLQSVQKRFQTSRRDGTNGIDIYALHSIDTQARLWFRLDQNCNTGDNQSQASLPLISINDNFDFIMPTNRMKLQHL